MRTAALALVALTWMQCAHAQPLDTASLTAKLSLEDLSGKSITEPDHGKAFRLRVDLNDAATGRAPNGLEIAGWIRRSDPLNRSCEDEARAYRVTRAIAEGAVDLNGVVLAVLNEDASVGIIDPKLNGQPANMLAAASLDTMPDDFIIDRANMRALFAFKSKGTVEEISLADGARQVIAQGLKSPSSLAVTSVGDVWIAEGGAVHRIGDQPVTNLGKGDTRLSITPDAKRIVAVSDGGEVGLVDIAADRIVMRGSLGHPISASTLVGSDAVLTLSPDGKLAELRYFDDFATPIAIPLGLAAKQIAVSPDGRKALAFAPGTPTVAIIDLATGTLAQSFALNDATVAEIGFTERAAFIATREGAYLGVLDLNSVKQGTAPMIRPVPLGGKGGASNGDRQLLASMLPSPNMLAVDRDSGTGWIVPELAAVGSMPPMDSVRLRGGVPLQVHIADRSFREIQPGRFETVAKVGDGGKHELVLTTGIGGLTACIPFDVHGPAAKPSRLYHVAVNPTNGSYRAEVPQEIEFTLSDEQGHNLDVETARFLVPSLVSGWSQEVVAHRAADGKLKATVRFPHVGIYAVQPIGVPKGWHLQSTPLIEVLS
ncbi:MULTISPECIES: hypothetical protein [Mesorhizobium]|uniref:hypothetical protein n=1 Tax=Mesorhizobium TaxID=68287 RepID=UPI001314ECA9|nr:MULTISPECIES: hypothetical protein [Mesorhizobium]